MGSVNKILILFFVILSLAFVGVIHLIQTESFSQLISERIKKEVYGKIEAVISFKRIQVKLFPPATILKGVKVQKKTEEGELYFFSKSVGLYFSLADFFSRSFTLNTLKLSGVDLSIIKSKNFGDEKFSYPELFKSYVEFQKSTKVKIENIEVSNLEAHFLHKEEDVELAFSKLSFSFFDNVFLSEGRATRIDASGINKLSGFNIDSADYLVYFTKNKIEIKRGIIHSKLDLLTVDGEIELLKNITNLKLDADLRAGVRSVIKKMGFHEEIVEYPVDGKVNILASIRGELDSPLVDVKGEVLRLDSPFGKADKILFNFNKSEDALSIDSFLLSKGNSSVKLKAAVKFFDLKKKEFLKQEAVFIVNNLHTNDALLALKDELSTLKGRFNGDVKIGWNKKGVFFIPENGFSLTDFKLYNSNYTTKILENKGFTFLNTKMFLTYDLVFSFDADLMLGDSKVSGSGIFTDNKMNVEIRKSTLGLDDLGPIVELPFEGSGLIKGRISGDYDSVTFSFRPVLNDFSVLGFNLGKLDGQLVFNLESMVLDVSHLKGIYNQTQYEGNANFHFLKDTFSLDVDIKAGVYRDLEKMLPTLISKIYTDDVDVDFNFTGMLKYQSSFDVEKLSIVAHAVAENVNIYGEQVGSLSASINLKEDLLRVDKFNIKKNQGNLWLTSDIDLAKRTFSYKGNVGNIALRDFDFYDSVNLGLNGKIRGELYGSGHFDEFTSRSQFRLEDSEIGNLKVKDSIFTIYNKGTDIFLSANLFKGVSISEGYISLDKKVSKKSYINTRLFTERPSLLAGMFSAHNYINKTLTGNVDLRAEVVFNYNDLESFDFDLSLNKLNLNFQNEYLRVDSKRNKIKIKKGIITKWDIFLAANDEGYVESGGKGAIAKDFDINFKYKFNLGFLKLATSKMLSSKGSVTGESFFKKSKGRQSLHSKTIGRNIDLKIEQLPGSLRNIDFRLISEGNVLLLESLKGQYGNGSIKAEGSVTLKFPFPVIKINGVVEGAQVPITDKTYVVVSGNGAIEGSSFPYLLKGDISVLHGEVFNEFEDFSKLVGLSDGYLRYIPRVGSIRRRDLLKYNLDFDIFNPVLVRNSIANLKVDGSLKIRGGMLKPLISGDVNILPAVSKVFFRGNEFVLSEGRLSFFDINEKVFPEIKLAGIANVDRYEVALAVDGRVDRFKIKLSSTPSLDQGQILALLVLGVPEDINQDLDDSDREQVAMQGGVGLIVERFKLVKPIDSMLGLKFSVGPEFQEDNSSLLEGRLNTASSGNSRYRSGTKIKVQKKILKKVDISFSNTLGGNVEETKKMNINYNIDKNLSLEGVYELRTIEEETEENPESIGADIKWKFSF